MKDTLKYYKKINSIPTVDYRDYTLEKRKKLKNHRYFFYFKLGININDFKGKNILEFCPGTGYNAQYLLENCDIKNFTLVDHNPQSIVHLRKNLKKFKNKRIINNDIRNFKSKEKFDYLIIENAIDAFSDAKKIFTNLSNYILDNGIVIITIGDYIGQFSTKLRFLLSIILCHSNKIKSYENKVKFLSNFFSRDLRYLSKISRSPNKWVIDNILNTEWIKKKYYFDYNQLKKANLRNYLIKSTSPLFYKDYMWYKNFDKKKYNSNILKSYERVKINFLDFETRFENSNKIVCKEILYTSALINKFNFDEQIDIKKVKKIFLKLKKISYLLNKSYKRNKVSLALNDYNDMCLSILKGEFNIKNSKSFYKFWGIGTQHISLQKIKN